MMSKVWRKVLEFFKVDESDDVGLYFLVGLMPTTLLAFLIALIGALGFVPVVIGLIVVVGIVMIIVYIGKAVYKYLERKGL